MHTQTSCWTVYRWSPFLPRYFFTNSREVDILSFLLCYCDWFCSVVVYTVLLANVNSSSCSLYVIVRPSVCLSVVCDVRAPYSDDWNFPQFLRHRVRWPSVDIQVKFYEDRPRGTPPSGELNRRGVAEYSDFGPIDGYISETVQDRRYVTIDH